MKKHILLLVVLATFLISCEPERPKVNNDSILTLSNISGSLNLFDEKNNSVPSDRVLVYLERGIGTYWGESEKDGSFIILNAPYYINYTIVYEKQGYGTYKIFGYQHEYTGGVGSITEAPSLGKISTTYATDLDIAVNGENTEFTMDIMPAPSDGQLVRIIFHSISAISNEVFSNYTALLAISDSEQTFVFSKEELEEIGLEPGVKYWAQAYGDSYHSNGFMDEDLGKYVLPNLGYKDDLAVPTEDFVMP
ncbi:MAG: hypothetical protein GQ527_05110 [Bacteroidales bacterium]|nr:hypothetical protein [Bacteroidales bacterium]